MFQYFDRWLHSSNSPSPMTWHLTDGPAINAEIFGANTQPAVHTQTTNQPPLGPPTQGQRGLN
jgi:hypothetical protein